MKGREKNTYVETIIDMAGMQGWEQDLNNVKADEIPDIIHFSKKAKGSPTKERK